MTDGATCHLKASNDVIASLPGATSYFVTAPAPAVTSIDTWGAIKAYNQPNYGGALSAGYPFFGTDNVFDFGYVDTSDDTQESGYYWTDVIRSFKITPGYCARFGYVRSNFNAVGQFDPYWGGVTGSSGDYCGESHPDSGGLAPKYVGRATLWFRGCPWDFGGVAYADPQWGGAAVCLNPGVYDSAALAPVGPNAISSFRARRKLTICDAPGLGGNCFVVGRNKEASFASLDYWNDRIQSLKLE